MNKLAKKRELLKKEFRLSLIDLDASLAAMDYSYQKCIKIGIKDDYTPDELEIFEALTSRFARTSDIFTQKILTSLFVLLKEDPKGFIDKANLSEKLGIIPDSSALQNIRELRNEIAHEYSLREISEIFEDVLNFSAALKTLLAQAQSFIGQKFPEPPEDENEKK